MKYKFPPKKPGEAQYSIEAHAGGWYIIENYQRHIIRRGPFPSHDAAVRRLKEYSGPIKSLDP